MKIAALISYFNDIDMLDLQFKSSQFDNYDRIYIFDGPFSYTKSIEFMSINPPKLTDTSVGIRILEDSRVIYEYREWKDEKEKRTEAYNRIEEDIVFLHDSDEFYTFDAQKFNHFLKSTKSVGAFLCQNLFLNGVHATNQFYATDDPQKLPHKNFVFKKSNISAEEHLNYLWLVGIDQQKPDLLKKFNEPIAIGYHFTGMRSEAGQVQKYIFYGALHYSKNDNKEFAPATRLSQSVKNHNLDHDQALNIYLNSIPGFHRCPNPNDYLIFKERIFVNELEPILKEVLKKISWNLKSNYLLFEDIPIYFIVINENKDLTFKINCDTMVDYECWRIQYDTEMTKYVSGEASEIEIKILSQSNSKNIASLIKVKNKVQRRNIFNLNISLTQ